ncbi:MAG: hypothetical protein QXO25_00625 [Candidatus Bathyarchaeia archaeon]
MIWVLLTVVSGAIILSILVSMPVIESKRTEQSEVRYFFSGDVGKVTQTFHIPTRNWKISYSVQGTDNSFFKFTVYREGSSVPIAEIPDLYTTESSYVIVDGGPGEFYLVVTSSFASWKITVTSINE